MSGIIEVTKIREFIGHRDAVYSLGYHRGSVISAGSDGWIVRWELDREDGTVLANVSEPIYSLYVDDTYILAGTSGGRLISVAPGQLKELKSHATAIFGLIVADGMIYSSSFDGNIIAYNEELTVLGQSQITKSSLRCLRPYDEKAIIACSSDNHIYFLNRDMEILNVLNGHKNSVFSAVTLEDGSIISTGRDATIRKWEEGVETACINAHLYTINDLSLSPDGKTVLSASMDKSIRIWNAQSLDLLKVIDPVKMESHRSSVNKVLWIDSEMFISCSDDSRLILWSFKKIRPNLS